MKQIKNTIEKAWEKSDKIDSSTTGEIRGAVQETLDALDSGKLRVAEKEGKDWIINEWAKKAVLLSFKLNPMELISNGPSSGGMESHWYDKVPSKFLNWDEDDFKTQRFRAVPGCFVRHSAYIAKKVVLMPSFINLGAYIDEGTMIDSWVTVGSCVQIGKDCHISSGVVLAGVIEPLQDSPVIIEDNVFIGACSVIAEGIIVGQGSVIAMGVRIGSSTKIYDRETGETYQGRVPDFSVVVPGTIPSGSPDLPSLYAPIIIKKVDAKTRSKTSINDLLRAA